MKEDKIEIKLPEISAKKFAEINGVSVNFINSLCRAGLLPARKLSAKKEKHRDDRGVWFVTLAVLEQELLNKYLAPIKQ